MTTRNWAQFAAFFGTWFVLWLILGTAWWAGFLLALVVGALLLWLWPDVEEAAA